MIVRVTPARSPASPDQWCQTFCRGRPLLHDPKWRNPPDLNPGCRGHMSGSVQAKFHAEGIKRDSFAQCAMAHRPAAEFTRGALWRLTFSSR